MKKCNIPRNWEASTVGLSILIILDYVYSDAYLEIYSKIPLIRQLDNPVIVFCKILQNDLESRKNSRQAINIRSLGVPLGTSGYQLLKGATALETTPLTL